jgi:hypothetical protein
MLTAPALATTWGGQTIEDPVSGAPCAVAVPASMGSYIYQWPEKFDQVFFPVTAEQGVWVCPSGFASLIGDVRLAADERARIAAFLQAQDAATVPPDDIGARLSRAAALYEIREMDAERMALVHRALAYGFEALAGDAKRAAQHREAALALMIQRLAEEDLAPGKRIEYLFVSANYLREAGDRARADRLLVQLEDALAAQTGGELADYASYIASMLPDSRRIAPGGTLAPAAD